MDEVIIRRGANGSLFAGDRNGHSVASLVPHGYLWYDVKDSEENIVIEMAFYTSAAMSFFAIVQRAIAQQDG